MELPASVAALGEQLCGAGEISPDPSLFTDTNVFAAERERIFRQPFLAADHQTRPLRAGEFFPVRRRAAVDHRDPRRRGRAPRSAQRLHPRRLSGLRCRGRRCQAVDLPYHGWEFALDGKLLEPELSARIDPARLRMASYPVAIHNGLVFVDVSGKAKATELGAISMPDWLPAAQVTRRARYSTTWNWKFLRNFLRSSPHLFFEGAPDAGIDFGPLSFLFVQSERAVLLRIIPKFPEQTACDVIELAADGEASAAASDPFGEALRHASTLRLPGSAAPRQIGIGR